jgi:hypothetical protein
VAETVCDRLNQGCLLAEKFGHPDVVDFVAGAVMGHDSHSQHDPAQPCSAVCHHCHGHSSHLVNLTKSANLASLTDVQSARFRHYFGRSIERIRSSIFRPPIAA